ncbi:MAG: prepilin-type N-terminal cleavage/methylation domain-containing protein [Deltaproteobacteria bacterium]|nr:prepilin-type N-terminal cleavage/methylation domain-containing protein [Deltaproteobacteria bacterium]
MNRIGWSIRPRKFYGPNHKAQTASSAGFTLIELILVVTLIGLMATLVVPKIPFTDNYALKTDTRRLSSLIHLLDEVSTTTKQYISVSIEAGAREVKISSSKDGFEFKEATGDRIPAEFKLSSKAAFAAIRSSGLGTVTDGEVTLIFNPLVGAEPFGILIERGTMRTLVSYNPYSGRVETDDSPSI